MIYNRCFELYKEYSATSYGLTPARKTSDSDKVAK